MNSLQTDCIYQMYHLYAGDMFIECLLIILTTQIKITLISELLMCCFDGVVIAIPERKFLLKDKLIARYNQLG